MQKTRLFPLLLLFCAMLEANAFAEIYKWVEDNGTVTYRDTPPPPGKQATTVELQDITLEYSKPFSPSDLLDSAKDKAAETAKNIGTQVQSVRMKGAPPANPEEYERQLGLR